MGCRDTRELADAFVSDQLLIETAQRIVAHLERCPSCRAEIDDLRRLRARLRLAFTTSPQLQPRPAFAASLRAQLQREAERRGAASSPWRTWMALAAALILVVGGGIGFRGIGLAEFGAILHAAVGDHRFCLVAFKLAERPIPLERAAELYDDPIDRSLETVEPFPTPLAHGPIRIVERHSCVYDGRRFAHLVLRYDHQLISLVVTPDDRLLRELPDGPVPADGSIVTLAPIDGFHVAAFRGPRDLVFVIASMADDALRDVATSMAPSVLQALKDNRE